MKSLTKAQSIDKDKKENTQRVLFFDLFNIHRFLERLLYSALELFLLLLSFLDEITVDLVCDLEELLDPEEAYRDKYDPVVRTAEALEGDHLHTEDYRRRSDTSAYDYRGDEPAELHPRRSRYHNERVVGEDREEHHKGEVYGSACTEELERLFTVLFAEHLFAYSVSSESAYRVKNGTAKDNAGVGEEEGHPWLTYVKQLCAEHNECRGNTGDCAKKYTKDYLYTHQYYKAVPLTGESLKYMRVKYEAAVVIQHVGCKEHCHSYTGYNRKH